MYLSTRRVTRKGGVVEGDTSGRGCLPRFTNKFARWRSLRSSATFYRLSWRWNATWRANPILYSQVQESRHHRRTRAKKMEEILRWCASLVTIVPGLVIAARVRPRWMGWAFVALTIGALTWIVVAHLSKDYSLLSQKVAITLIHTLGINLWLIR